MTKVLNNRLFIFGLPLLLLAVVLILPHSALYQAQGQDLSLALSIDVLVTIPLVYFLLIRKQKSIPNYTAFSLLVICLLSTAYLLPAEEQFYLKKVRTIIVPLIELSAVSFIILKTRKIIKNVSSSSNADFYNAVLMACKASFPNRVASILTTEIAVVYYAFSGKRKKALSAHEFTYFKRNGIRTAIGAFIGIILIETLGVHFLINIWSGTAAWILSALSVYTALQLMALMRSMPKRLIRINHQQNSLELRYGLFSQSTISLAEIATIEVSRKPLDPKKLERTLSPLGALDGHNIIITLKGEHILNGLYGIEKPYRKIGVWIDEKELFLEQIKQYVN